MIVVLDGRRGGERARPSPRVGNVNGVVKGAAGGRDRTIARGERAVRREGPDVDRP